MVGWGTLTALAGLGILIRRVGVAGAIIGHRGWGGIWLRLIPHRREGQLTSRILRRNLAGLGIGTRLGRGLGISLSLFGLLALGVLLLLASLPLLADFLELCQGWLASLVGPTWTSACAHRGRGDSTAHTFRSSLWPVMLHLDVSIEMVQGAVCFLAVAAARERMIAQVHALDILPSPAWSLGLLGPGNRHKGVHLREHVSDTIWA